MSGCQRVSARALGAVLALCLLVPAASAFADDGDATVDMQGISFVPKEIHISPGATITWTNSSPLAHTVTADDGSFDSGLIDPGATWSMAFDAGGPYRYYCQPHGGPGGTGMAGVIIVDDAAAMDTAGAAAAPAVVKPNQPKPDEYYPDH